MTTATILLIGMACILIFAFVNVILWVLEVIASFAKCFVAYLFGRPHDFVRSYIDIRIMFTQLLLKVSYAMLSPKQIVKYSRHIKAEAEIKAYRRTKRHQALIKKIKRRL